MMIDRRSGIGAVGRIGSIGIPGLQTGALYIPGGAMGNRLASLSMNWG